MPEAMKVIISMLRRALDADHAAVEEGQARGHEHHQGGADEHEAGVGGSPGPRASAPCYEAG